MLIKSINGWSFGKEVSAVDRLRVAKEAGFEAIELTIDEAGPMGPGVGEDQCRAIAAEADRVGIKIASLATGLFWRYSYGSEDAADRERAVELTVGMMDRARWLGTDAILVVPATVGRWDGPLEVPYETAMNRTYSALEGLKGEAERRGVRIGIENVWNRFLLSPTEARDLIDKVNSPWVGFYFDVGNVVPWGYPQDWIRSLGKRIVRVHVKDFKIAIGGIKGFCPLGEGDVDWPAVWAALEEAGYDGPVTSEVGGTIEEISKGMDEVLGRRK